MTRANIPELQNNLSAYLALVRAGETVLVIDHSTPVARIVPPEQEPKPLDIQEPSVPVEKIRRRSRLELEQEIDVDALLRQERDSL